MSAPQPTIDSTTVYALNEAFAWEPMPDGCFVFSSETGQILSLNAAAEIILSYFNGTDSLERVYAELAREEAIAQPDFLEVVRQMVEQKILLPLLP